MSSAYNLQFAQNVIFSSHPSSQHSHLHLFCCLKKWKNIDQEVSSSLATFPSFSNLNSFREFARTQHVISATQTPLSLFFQMRNFFIYLFFDIHIHIHCNQYPIYVFPEKDQRGLSPSYHIHVSVSDLYIPRIGAHIFLQKNRQTDCGTILYKSLTNI